MRSQRIIRPATAFSIVSTKQKRRRVTDEAHLKWIRTLHCCLCGKPGPDPAHIRSANSIYGKSETGGGQKSSDKWTVLTLHREPSRRDSTKLEIPTIAKWWRISEGANRDPFGLRSEPFQSTGDDEIAEGILRKKAHRVR